MPLTVLIPIVTCLAFQAPTKHPQTPPKPHKASKPVSKAPAHSSWSTFVPPAPGPNAVLARVNGVAIKTSDVESIVWDWAGRGVIDDLILIQLIRDRAALDKVSVTPLEVERQFTDQLAMIQRQVPPGQDLDSYIRDKGFPKSRLYLHVEADLLMTKIVDTQFKPTDYVNVSMLLVRPKVSQPSVPTPTTPGSPQFPQRGAPQAQPSDQDKQEALGKAVDIYNRLKRGDDWDQMLKSTDQSPAVIRSHGSLGWRSIDDFPPLTQAELKTLKAHEFTKPFEAPNGIQILRLDDTGNHATAADLTMLKRQYEARAKQTLLQQLQSTGKVERFFGEAPKTSHLQKLGIQDVRAGSGQPVEPGDEVWVTYTGRTADGKVFDTNARPGGSPFHVTVGVGQVIKGWDQGLLGMRKGGLRRLSIPAALAYGAHGMGAIQPNADLYFDVTLVDLLKKKDANTISANDVVAGAGREIKIGDTVTIDYTCSSNGKVVETQKEIQFQIGSDQMKIPGFDHALIGMKVGGRRDIKVPPALLRVLGDPNLGSGVAVYTVTLKSAK